MNETIELPPKNEIYGVFAASIDTQVVQRTFSSFALMMNSKATHVHLLFQSTGGYIGDGIALYNFSSI